VIGSPAGKVVTFAHCGHFGTWIDEWDGLKPKRGARARRPASPRRRTTSFRRGTTSPPTPEVTRRSIDWGQVGGGAVGIFALAWVIWWLWAVFGVTKLGFSQMNYTTLRSDIGKVHLPAGYEKVSTSESGNNCAGQSCTLTELWVWHGSGVRTATDACQDISKAMDAAFSPVYPNDPIPQEAACDYYAILSSFLHPGQGKRTVQALVWVNNGTVSYGDHYILEVLGSYNARSTPQTPPAVPAHR
jgi:hypothetical protein